MSKGKQLLSEPVWTQMQISTKNFRRLGYFGKPNDSFDTIIDYFDGILNKNAITLPKQSDRQSLKYRNLYLQREEED